MKKPDIKELNKLLSVFGAGFDIEVSDVKVKFYYGALEDLPIEYIRDALNVLVRTWKAYGRLPAPVEIREANQLDGDAKAIEAWDVTWKALDPYKSVKFEDPCIMATIEQLGGWVKFASGDDYMRDEGQKWMRKDFIATYQTVSKTNIRPPEYFPGIFEIGNEGCKKPTPILIGGRAIKEVTGN